MFTRQHYEAIATVIQQYFAEQDYATKTHGPKPNIVDYMTMMFEADNPRFDTVKFYDACESVE
tara:strand:+ start:370 stop:558 length:189 start_codon:yes stop_codon:yes gene_type:complete